MMTEQEAQAYMQGWDDAIKHISNLVPDLSNKLLKELCYKDKHYVSLSHKDRI